MNSATSDAPFLFSPTSSPLPASGAAAVPRSDRSPDSLVDETRREISQIVREVALAVRSERSRDAFLKLLADRILRAMAAEGVVIWRCEAGAPPDTPRAAPPEPSQPPQPRTETMTMAMAIDVVQRIGTITDRSIPASSAASHHRLLAEIVTVAEPVVVPCTPEASDPNVPANPTQFPAAIVPISCDPQAGGESYLLEVFLEPGGGVATQRGYLRFIAQMADLAGEFLRADQLRDLHRRHNLAAQVDAVIASIHRLD
ncbi:MAG: phytochrome sensor protein, partial [Novipirellula sp. JB048]